MPDRPLLPECNDSLWLEPWKLPLLPQQNPAAYGIRWVTFAYTGFYEHRPARAGCANVRGCQNSSSLSGQTFGSRRSTLRIVCRSWLFQMEFAFLRLHLGPRHLHIPAKLSFRYSGRTLFRSPCLHVERAPPRQWTRPERDLTRDFWQVSARTPQVWGSTNKRWHQSNLETRSQIQIAKIQNRFDKFAAQNWDSVLDEFRSSRDCYGCENRIYLCFLARYFHKTVLTGFGTNKYVFLRLQNLIWTL